MEITNFSSSIVPIPVGLRVAQIVFHSTKPVESSDIYNAGKYQTKSDLEQLKK